MKFGQFHRHIKRLRRPDRAVISQKDRLENNRLLFRKGQITQEKRDLREKDHRH